MGEGERLRFLRDGKEVAKGGTIGDEATFLGGLISFEFVGEFVIFGRISGEEEVIVLLLIRIIVNVVKIIIILF